MENVLRMVIGGGVVLGGVALAFVCSSASLPASVPLVIAGLAYLEKSRRQKNNGNNGIH